MGRRAALLALGLVVTGAGVWGFWIEPSSLVVREHRLDVPGFTPGAPLRVALLSDLHVGSPHSDTRKLRAIVRRANATRPHLILLAGDYVGRGMPFGTYVAPETTGEILRGLSAPLGVYAVLGNHDYGMNGPRIAGALRLGGIRVLEDQGVRIGGGDASERTTPEDAPQPFWLVGVSDLLRGPHDLEGALAQVTDDAPVILLTHNPDLFPEVPARVCLTLAGHTHGGQIFLPILGRPIVPSRYGSRYAAGHVVERGRHLFVTTGLGTSILPVRILVPPEISLLTIGAAPPDLDQGNPADR